MSSKGRVSDEEVVSLQLDRVWRNVFDKYDVNKDDKISLEEFKVFLKERNQEISNDIPEEVLDEIIERIDWDKNRYITYNEFIRMIHSCEKSHHHRNVDFIMRNVAKVTVPKRERQSVLRRYFDEFQFFRFPFFIITISIIEICVFIYRWTRYGPFATIHLTDNALIYDPHKRKEIWRYLTYMFVHRDVFHILYNILGQLIVGIPLELVHNSWRVGFIFLISTVAGSLYSAIIDPQVYICGASGGNYALFSAHASNLIINFKEIDFAIYQLIFLVMVYSLDFGQAIYYRVNRTIEERPIAYVVHIAGFFCGLLIGIIVLRNLKVHKWEQIVGYMSLALFVFGFITAIVYNLMMAHPFEDKKWLN